MIDKIGVFKTETMEGRSRNIRESRTIVWDLFEISSGQHLRLHLKYRDSNLK